MGSAAGSDWGRGLAGLPAGFRAGKNAGSAAGAFGDQIGADHCVFHALEV